MKARVLWFAVVCLSLLLILLYWIQDRHSTSLHSVIQVDLLQQHKKRFKEWLFATSDIASSVCRDSICSEFLSKDDSPWFNYCVKKTWHVKITEQQYPYPEPDASVCRFMNGTDRNPVALASFSGSGNTWVRGLLQGVTGLCTGGVYCDVTLRANGFPGEELRTGAVLVVKTHRTDPRWTGVKYDDSSFSNNYYNKPEDMPVFSGAILIVRNPFDALVAAYNRFLNANSTDHHILHAKPEEFGNYKGWNEFVTKRAEAWQDLLITFLLRNHDHPVMAVKYEDLKRDAETELKRMLEFLKVPYEMSVLKEVVGRDYTKYKREKMDFVRYTKEQRNYVQGIIQDTVNILADNADLLTEKLNIQDYLSSNITVQDSIDIDHHS